MHSDNYDWILSCQDLPRGPDAGLVPLPLVYSRHTEEREEPWTPPSSGNPSSGGRSRFRQGPSPTGHDHSEHDQQTDQQQYPGQYYTQHAQVCFYDVSPPLIAYNYLRSPTIAELEFRLWVHMYLVATVTRRHPHRTFLTPTSTLRGMGAVQRRRLLIAPASSSLTVRRSCLTGLLEAIGTLSFPRLPWSAKSLTQEFHVSPLLAM